MKRRGRTTSAVRRSRRQAISTAPSKHSRRHRERRACDSKRRRVLARIHRTRGQAPQAIEWYRARRGGAGAIGRRSASAAVRARRGARVGRRDGARSRDLHGAQIGGRATTAMLRTRVESAVESASARIVVLIRRLVYVAFFLEVGLLLLVLPWSAFWEQNYFTDAWSWTRVLLSNNFVRGAVSGVGIVNLVAGFADLALVFAARERHDAPYDPTGHRDDLPRHRSSPPGCRPHRSRTPRAAGVDLVQVREARSRGSRSSRRSWRARSHSHAGTPRGSS